MFIVFEQNFIPIKYSILVFLADFVIRVFISPKFSPSLIIGRIIVSKQNPEYVGAAQKKFAWIIGVILAFIMFFLMVILNSYSFISGIICLICLIFLFCESVFGICLGCVFYGWFYKEKAQYCPGEICDVKEKQKIQKISLTQLVIILGFIIYVVLMEQFFNSDLSKSPNNLWEILATLKMK